MSLALDVHALNDDAPANLSPTFRLRQTLLKQNRKSLSPLSYLASPSALHPSAIYSLDQSTAIACRPASDQPFSSDMDDNDISPRSERDLKLSYALDFLSNLEFSSQSTSTSPLQPCEKQPVDIEQPVALALENGSSAPSNEPVFSQEPLQSNTLDATSTSHQAMPTEFGAHADHTWVDALFVHLSQLRGPDCEYVDHNNNENESDVASNREITKKSDISKIRAAQLFLQNINLQSLTSRRTSIKRSNHYKRRERRRAKLAKQDDESGQFIRVESSSSSDTDSSTSSSSSNSTTKHKTYICKPPGRLEKPAWEQALLSKGLVNSRVVYNGMCGFVSSTLLTKTSANKSEHSAPYAQFLRHEGSKLRSKHSNLSFSNRFLPDDSNQDVDYDPFLLDDPNLKSGKHRTVMTLPGFMESVIAWVQESEYLKELNEQFKLKHPNLPASLSLSKIRKMKRLFLETTTHLDLEVSTAVLAILYFETLCLKCLVDKVNRKLVSATCFFLAFKFNEAGPHHSVTLAKLLETLESTFDVRRFDIFRSEFDVLVELDFNLHFTSAHVLPHFARVLQQLELVAQEYLGTQMYSDVYGINEDIGLGEVDEDDQHQHEIDVERSMHEHDQADSHELRVQIDPDDEVLINTSMMNTSFLSN